VSRTSTTNDKTTSRKDRNVFSILSPERIARQSARHPWFAAALWVLIVVAAFMGAGMTVTNDRALRTRTTSRARPHHSRRRLR
jgi:hypothetical protein